MIIAEPKVTRPASIKSSLPWMIWGLGALFYAYEFFLQVSPSVMVPELMQAFNVNAAALGNLAALYFYADAIMQIPAGLFLDTLGPRRLLTASITICVLGAITFGSAHILWHAQIGRLLIGIGSSTAVLGAFKLASTWFPPNRFALVAGLTVMTGMLGAIIGGAPLALLVKTLGWRHSMLFLGGMGFLLGCLIWSIVRDTPNHAVSKNTANVGEQTKLLPSLIYILKQKQNWLNAIYGGLMFAPTSAFAALWGVSFLQNFYDIHRAIAASAISMIFFGWALASPLWGWFSDFILKRKFSMYIGAIGGSVTMLMILYVHLPMPFLYVTLFLFGILSAGFLPSFSIIREINPPNISATALGFMNMMNMLGGAILQPLIGFILDHYWIGKTTQGTRIFSMHGYHMAMFTLPLILFLAFLIVPFIRETNCLQTNDWPDHH